ncbi:ankyrin repeat domain-containing protein [bacterium]|nr:MAG: ankyrin repeat domain-containing protein [bacterium]
MHLAVQKGNKEIVNFLLNSDADVNTKDKYGKTAFDLALDQEIKHML